MLGIANIEQSIAAQSGLKDAVKARAQSIERLSSGRRINRAADDVARSATATKLEAKIRSQGQVNRNINDAISVIQTAEGGCSEIQGILTRCRELAVQAGNGSLTASDKGFIQQEMRILGHASPAKGKIDFPVICKKFAKNSLHFLNHHSHPGTILPCKILFPPRNYTSPQKRKNVKICNSLYWPRNYTSQNGNLD